MFKQLYDEKESEILLDNLHNELDYVPREYMVFRIFGKQLQLPRDKQFYGDCDEDGSTPLYRYGGEWYPPVLPWTKTLKKIRDDIYKFTGQYCNHVVVNRYLDGSDHIGYHHDKTGDFEDNTSVMTVSFGSERCFQLKNLKTKKVTSFQTKNGSLCRLDWKTNETYKHRIAKTNKEVGERISLTYRSIKNKRTKQENEKAASKIF
jgi:alkylated DNA repair dioxygenase AlkB